MKVLLCLLVVTLVTMIYGETMSLEQHRQFNTEKQTDSVVRKFGVDFRAMKQKMMEGQMKSSAKSHQNEKYLQKVLVASLDGKSIHQAFIDEISRSKNINMKSPFSQTISNHIEQVTVPVIARPNEVLQSEMELKNQQSLNSQSSIRSEHTAIDLPFDMESAQRLSQVSELNFMKDRLLLMGKIQNGNLRGSLSVGGGGNRPGGASPISIDRPEVLSSAQFAMKTAFGDSTVPRYVIVSATKQVVNGVIYEIIIDIHRDNMPCVVEKFKVLNHFGDLSLLRTDVLSEKCTSA